jgi:DNA-binding NtrC family response regulator
VHERTAGEKRMNVKKILVVDDEQGVLDYFSRLLAEPGYEVHGATSGQEALDKLWQTEFDMLILDLVMPGMDGMEVLRKARETHKDMIVLVITGYPSEETTRESIERGCIDYVHKPFEHEEVKNLIRDAFEARLYKLRNIGHPVRN